jgi:hypothetical protein
MDDMPDDYYRAGFIAYTFGAALLAFTAAACVPALCCVDAAHRRCVYLVARLQLLSGAFVG